MDSKKKRHMFPAALDKESSCPLCGNAKTDTLIQVPREAVHPCSGRLSYHLECYLDWVVPAWADYLRDIRHMEPRTVQNYEGFVQRVIEARLSDPGSKQDILNPDVSGLTIPLISGKGSLSAVSLAKSVTPAWTDFLAWCLNALEVPACFLDSTQDTNYFSDLRPHWHAWLKKQGVTDSCISKYFKDVGFYVMGSGPYSREGTPTKPNGAADPAWSGRYGFWTWYTTIEHLISKEVPVIEAPKQTMLDLAPDVAEDPVLVGPSFEPRTDATTLDDKVKRGPKVPLTAGAVDDLSDVDESDMTPVPEASQVNMTPVPEASDADFDLSDFDLDTDSKDLIAMVRKEFVTWDALCQKFPDFTAILLGNDLITMSEILERAEPSEEDSPAVFMFRYLDRLCRTLK